MASIVIYLFMFSPRDKVYYKSLIKYTLKYTINHLGVYFKSCIMNIFNLSLIGYLKYILAYVHRKLHKA